MSDLISRNTLLNEFNNTGIQITFDLPVEEILGEDVDIDDFTMLVQDAIQSYKALVIDTIKKQSTAYDVDKVANAVVEITERISNNCDEIELDWPEEERTGYSMHDDIMQIRHLVKYGGIGTDDACEWRLKDDYQWHTGCRNKIDNMDNEAYTIEDYIEYTRFNYCPFCGKKIKVVE